MNSLNRAQIIGNLTRDPELRQTTGGQSVCSFGVATNRRWKDSAGELREEVEFHNIVCWGKTAEFVSQYIKKGNRIFVEGRLQTRNWEDEAGVKHYRTEIIAFDIMNLAPRENNGNSGTDDVKQPAKPVDDEAKVEDLPF